MDDASERLRAALSIDITRNDHGDLVDSPIESASKQESARDVRLQIRPTGKEVFVQIETAGPPAALIALEILDHLDEMLVRVFANGTIEYGKRYDPDDAARIFWAAMANYFSRSIRASQARG